MMKSQTGVQRKHRFRLTDDDLWGYAFILVSMIAFGVFTLYPVISAVETSFLKYKPFGSEFIGLKNYQDTFSSSLFYKTVLNTLEYTVVVVPLSLLMAFAISIMILPFSKKTQSVFKSMYYLPGIASGVALSVVWLWIYDSSPTGLMNQVFTFLRLPTQNWLSSSKTSMISLMFMALMSGQGSNIIIYIAALLGIDNSYFEAAELDGAGRLTKLIKITIPMSTPMIFYNLVTGIIGALQANQTMILFGGNGAVGLGPDKSLYFVCVKIYNTAFRDFHQGYASAYAWFLFMIIAVLTAVIFKTNKWVYYGDD